MKGYTNGHDLIYFETSQVNEPYVLSVLKGKAVVNA